jgi:hypothetical protein
MSDRFKYRLWNKTGKYMITESGNAYYDLDMSGRVFQDLKLVPSVVIMQCTGLKDKNGTLLYEGDIYRCDFLSADHIDTITWCDSMPGFGFSCDWAVRFEIIGNIYQDSHLLENK